MNYIKKIGIDLRFFDNKDYYSNFILELIKVFIKENKDYFFNIYLNSTIPNLGENTKNFLINIKNQTLQEQIKFNNFLIKQNNDLMLFFNYFKPIKYNKKYIIFLKNLENLHFIPTTNFIKKYLNNYLINSNLKNAQKIIVFDKYSKEELNDKLNIPETKIEILQGFFKKYILKDSLEIIDISIKYNINGPFLIYNAGKGDSKNLQKLIEITKKTNYNLAILDNNTSTDLNFRKEILKNNLTNKIFFIGDLNDTEKQLFYKKSIGVIYPSLYSSFPFCLNDALNYNKIIFSSNLKILKDIFGENIVYFNPNNTYQIIKQINNNIGKNTNYENIFNKYNIHSSLEDLKKIIKSV